MTEIKKKVYITRCIGKRVDENGEFIEAAFNLNGRFTAITATKKLRRMQSDPSITINKVMETQEVYKMSIEDFIAHAEKVTEPKEEKVNKND